MSGNKQDDVKVYEPGNHTIDGVEITVVEKLKEIPSRLPLRSYSSHDLDDGVEKYKESAERGFAFRNRFGSYWIFFVS